MSIDSDRPAEGVRNRFGWLLKHARERMSRLSAEELGSLGVSGRELAVLVALADGPPPSQLEAARRLSIDRTSMVQALDELERRGLVERRADATDRRRNAVLLTRRGRDVMISGSRATDEAERRFLAVLPEPDRERLRRLLRRVAEAPPDSPADDV